MAFTWVTAMGSLERIRSNILCPRVGKCTCWVRAFSVMHVTNELCAFCIRTSNCRPLDSREIEIAKNDKIFTVKRKKGN